jgi:hypothetical protein
VIVEVRTDGGFDPCIGGGSSRDCERGECTARAVCVAAQPVPVPTRHSSPAAPATYVQRRRGWRRPDNAVYCDGRHSDTGDGRFALRIGVGAVIPDGIDWEAKTALYKRIRTPEDLVAYYRVFLRAWKHTQEDARRELPGKALVCRCEPGAPCHVQDVLLPLVNEGVLP